MLLMHGTCVSVNGKGVLLQGEAGSGKSNLALLLMDRGAALVADDQVMLRSVRKKLLASPPEQLEGLFEVRGVGIFQMAYEENVPVSVVVKLVARSAVERMPENEFFDCLGVQVPVLSLHAFDNSADAKIRLFLRTV